VTHRKEKKSKKKKGTVNRRPPTHTAAPFTMLNDNFDALHARSSAGMGGSEPVPPYAALGLRSCSGEGDGGNGRTDPLRGGGDRTVNCCGDRSDGGGGGTGCWGIVSGGSGKTNASATSGIALCGGGTVAIGVSPSRWRKSASGAMCAMRSPIGVVGIGVGISSGESTGRIASGGDGVVERPDGALRIRRRCLSDAVRE
jgi:hypothetical protein